VRDLLEVARRDVRTARELVSIDIEFSEELVAQLAPNVNAPGARRGRMQLLSCYNSFMIPKVSGRGFVFFARVMAIAVDHRSVLDALSRSSWFFDGRCSLSAGEGEV